MIGFDIAEVKTAQDMDKTTDELENEILTVSEARKNRSKKVRQVESIVRICLKKCALRSWKDQMKKLTKMLATVEDIKYEVNDVVSGFNW